MTFVKAPTAHLLIGLGGLGTLAVRRSSRVLARRAPGGGFYPLSGLGIDTDEAVLTPGHEGSPSYEGMLLATDEFAALLKRPEDYPPVADWLPSDLPPSEPGRGLRASRPLGRLAFFVHRRALEQRLGAILGRLAGAGLGVDPRPQGLRVLVVSSLGGGTGSGMFCDLAYMVQRLVQGTGLACRCEGLVLLGSTPPKDEAQSANVYAGMVELNHWMAADTRYDFEYASGERWETQRPPFDHVHLLASPDPGDEAARRTLVDQASGQTALAVWEDYVPLQERIAGHHGSFQRETDGRGNPVSYFSSGLSTLNLPAADLELAGTARLAARIVKRWRTTLFRAGAGTDLDEGRRHAEGFVTAQELNTMALRRRLEEQLHSETEGRFRPERILDRVREDQARTPRFGPALAQDLAEADRRLAGHIASAAEGGLAQVLAQQAGHLLERRSQALVQELASFFRAGREHYLGFCVFLDQLSEQIGNSLNELHQSLNRREAAELRMEDDKRLALEAISGFEPGLLQRLTRRIPTRPIEHVLQVLHDYYDTRLRLFLDREALNVYLGLLDTLQRFSNGVTELLEYLDDVEVDLVAEEALARQRLFSLPGEVLLTPAEVDRYLEERCSPERVAQATESLLKQVGQDLFSLPRTSPRPVWIASILRALGPGAPRVGADVVQAFLGHYPGEAARDRLRTLFERARPTLAAALSVPDFEPQTEPRMALVGLPADQDPDSEARSEARDLVLDHLGRLPADHPLTVVPLPGGERLAFVRISGGFPLDSLDLHACHRTYLQTLRLGRRRIHTRTDVRWRALGRPSAAQIRDIQESLAMGLHLGMLAERPEGGSDPIDRLESPRWPDLTALKSCLRLYADPVEALHVEQDFLTALHRWQDQRLDETGAEGFRRSLVSDLRPLRFLGRDLDAALQDAVATLDARLEEKWPQWSKAITRALQQEPSVATTDLVAVPVGVRRWALLRYIKEHSEENLTYHAASGRLELVSARDVETLDRSWRRLQESAEGDPEAFAENARNLVHFLCTCLGFSPGEALGLGNLRGVRVGTHGLRIRIPNRIPILVSRPPLLTRGDVEALRSLMEQGGLDSRFGLLVTLGDPQQNIRMIDEHLRTLLRYDVIVLGHAQLRDILRVRWRLRALVARILEQVDLTVVSPFVTEGPVPSSMFFGREGEIKEIGLRIETSSLALVGPRRIGKTSILQRVLTSIRNRPRPVVYLDCQSVYDAPSFLAALAVEYAPALVHEDFSSPAAFRPLLEALRAGYAGAPAQFILDEVDLILREDPEGAEGLFRAFRVAEAEGAAHFLFCGERTLLHRLRDPDSALFNFCHSLRVQFLEARDATRLIAEPLEQMEVHWEDREAGIQRILEITGGHPNLIQRTCASLVELLNQERTRRIKREHLDGVVADPAFVEEYLDTLWGRASEAEKILTLALGPDEEASPPELRRRLQEDYDIELAAPALLEGLENLCLIGIMERRGSRYRFAARYLPSLLREVFDVAEEIQLHKEMMIDGG